LEKVEKNFLKVTTRRKTSAQNCTPGGPSGLVFSWRSENGPRYVSVNQEDEYSKTNEAEYSLWLF
jgi:hypothetical protein